MTDRTKKAGTKNNGADKTAPGAGRGSGAGHAIALRGALPEAGFSAGDARLAALEGLVAALPGRTAAGRHWSSWRA